MLAAAVLWIAIQADLASPELPMHQGWSVAAVGTAVLEPLYTYPGYEAGLRLDGGFRLRRPLRRRLGLALTGVAGVTRVDDWRPIFEAGATLDGLPAGFELRAGARHDDRLAREGRLADFRDPTGRIFLEASTWPLRRGPFSVGASVEYERAMPGNGRLPSGVSGRAAVRLSWSDRQ
jgi:hypothetical protein